MAALSGDRIYFGEEGIGQQREAPLAAGVVAFRGAFLCVNALGVYVPGSDTAGLTAAKGVCTRGADNSTGANGAAVAIVRRGERAFFFTTNDANAITEADIGRDAFVVDDQTVARRAGTTNEIVAGEVLKVETVAGQVRITLKVGDA